MNKPHPPDEQLSGSSDIIGFRAIHVSRFISTTYTCGELSGERKGFVAGTGWNPFRQMK